MRSRSTHPAPAHQADQESLSAASVHVIGDFSRAPVFSMHVNASPMPVAPRPDQQMEWNDVIATL
jgi:hypothetical protein